MTYFQAFASIMNDDETMLENSKFVVFRIFIVDFDFGFVEITALQRILTLNVLRWIAWSE